MMLSVASVVRHKHIYQLNSYWKGVVTNVRKYTITKKLNDTG